MENLSIYETTSIINSELEVVYTPSSKVTKYTYQILEDGSIIQTYNITSNKESTIKLDESGNFQILITEYDYNNNITTIQSGVYELDLQKPVIRSEQAISVYELKKNQEIYTTKDLNITAYDSRDGDITSSITCDFENVDFTELGIQKLACSVSDEAGNISMNTITLNVVESEINSLYIVQTSTLSILLIILFLIIRFRVSLNFEKRIARYSLEPIKDKKISVIDKLSNQYRIYNRKLSKILKKSEFANRYSKRYNKYLVLYNKVYEEGMEFVSTKLLIAVTFIFIAIFSKMLQYQLLNFYEGVIPLLFGFFLPDIIYMSKYRLYRNKLENDLLQAIIVMNNSFKSGRSIVQAVEIVSKELVGPIAVEFEKMYMELNFGLGIDIVFDRFSKRIDLEEVAYLTASLSILNKTGGNIIKVFTSIENNLFNKKKLKLELNSLTGSSRLIVGVLYAVPLLFIASISFISPNYFEGFYTTVIGLVFSVIMIVMYIVYIIVIQKIMKVRM